MMTWWWPTHSLILAMVAGPSFSTADGGVLVDVVGFDVDVGRPCRPLAGAAVQGRSGEDDDDAEGLDLAVPQRRRVAVCEQLVGERAHEVVEGLQGQGVAVQPTGAASGEVAGLGVGELHVPGRGPVPHGPWSRGRTAAAAWATSRSVMIGPTPIRSASWSSTHRAPRRAGVGSAGQYGGPARPGLAAKYAFAELGVAVDAGRGRRPSGSWPRWGPPIASRGLRGRTRRPRVSPHRRGTHRSGRPRRAAGCLDAGVRGRGVQDGPLVGQSQAAHSILRSSLDCGFRGEHAGGVEVSDLVPLSGCRAHRNTKHRPPTVEGPRIPLSTRVLRLD